MVDLSLRFPAGRYHATPWGHHVNEGLVEWPPSPWRLMRALVSTGYTHLGWWREPDPPAAASSLFAKLASVLPHYRLPPATTAHSRHYMPQGKLKGLREETSLVLDTWARVAGGELLVSWPVDLAPEELHLLATLAERIPYLGRSESLVVARLLADGDALPEGQDVRAAEEPPGRDFQRVPLLAPVTPQAYRSWREEATRAALGGLPSPAGKKKASKALQLKRAKALEPYPRDLLATLSVGTTWLKVQGWSEPPGSRRVAYWRRRDALRVVPPRVHSRPPAGRVLYALLAIAAEARGRGTLPPVVRTLPQGELLHRALAGWLGKAGGAGEARELIGLDQDGWPLCGHAHAHILPLDLDRDAHLDHILVWAPSGLGPAAQRALRAVRRTWTKGQADLHLAVAAWGGPGDLQRVPGPLGTQLRAVIGPPGGARCWRSLTPFIPSRHLKRRGRNSLQGLVQQELGWRGMPGAAIELDERGSREFRAHVMRRTHGGSPPPRERALCLRLRFDAPQAGPIALGYASHFGMGLFAAETE